MSQDITRWSEPAAHSASQTLVLLTDLRACELANTQSTMERPIPVSMVRLPSLSWNQQNPISSIVFHSWVLEFLIESPVSDPSANSDPQLGTPFGPGLPQIPRLSPDFPYIWSNQGSEASVPSYHHIPEFKPYADTVGFISE